MGNCCGWWLDLYRTGVPGNILCLLECQATFLVHKPFVSKPYMTVLWPLTGRTVLRAFWKTISQVIILRLAGIKFSISFFNWLLINFFIDRSIIRKCHIWKWVWLFIFYWVSGSSPRWERLRLSPHKQQTILQTPARYSTIQLNSETIYLEITSYPPLPTTLQVPPYLGFWPTGYESEVHLVWLIC